jgi:hypothetical protein
MPTIDEIRDALQQANDTDGSGPYEAICPFFADRVNCIHEPRIPFDGVWDADVLARWLPIERQVMNKVMTNRRHEATFTIENGDQIAMDGTLSGEMPDGTIATRSTRTVWTIEDGQIVQQLDDGTGFDQLENPLATMLGGLDISFTALARENGITLPDFYAEAVAAAGM